MKQLVVLSGKGGTGKTSVTAALAHLAAEGARPIKAVLADADVDAANLELVLAPQEVSRQDFWGGQVAQIDAERCGGCGTCEVVCRFDAVSAGNGHYQVDPIACEGCAACLYQCPEGAIQMQSELAGVWFHSQSRYGPLFHAALRPAQENSGKLVTVVKQQARLLALDDETYELVLVDGPPGIGCPVISALSGADLALIVTEPTVSGAHDLQRILETAWHFGVETLVCLNKADLYPGANVPLRAFCQAESLELVGEIPFDAMVTEAMTQGQPVTAYQPHSPASRALAVTWQRLLDILQEAR